MMKLIVLMVFLMRVAIFSVAQTGADVKNGSYLYYGQPYLEDNSMLIDEAFNQESGVIQHISNMMVSGSKLNYSYTQEIPLVGDKHQLSFTFSYVWDKAVRSADLRAGGNFSFTNGFGDMLLSYQPLIAGKNDWALVVPRLSLMIPTGNSQAGFGNGGWGGQFNLAVTKRLSEEITAHVNTGYTYVFHADHYRYEGGKPIEQYEKNIAAVNIGASLIWLAKKRVHLLTEYICSYEKHIEDDGTLSSNALVTVNPGVRYAFDISKVQVVPGVGIPVSFYNGSFESTGIFLYLSVESCYTTKNER